MKTNIYENKSLAKLLFIFGIPSILALMMEMLTGIVDAAFAGNLPGIGSSALSAMALISPLLGIFTALQTLFAMSTGVLIAKYLNTPKQRSISYATGVLMSAVVSFSTSLICYFTLPQILSALGAKGEIFLLAKEYIKIQLLSNIVSSVGYTLTCCIRAFGFPKVEVKIITVAVAVNICFNYIFAFLFKMGIAGLAWGTFVSELVCAFCSVVFLVKKKLWIEKSSASAMDFFCSAWELFKIGISQTVIQALGGCTGFVINERLLALGSISHVAAWSVVQRIYTFILIPIVGLTQGVQSIISYFCGTGNTANIKKISKHTMLLCGGYGFTALLAVNFFGQNMAAFFGGNDEIIALANIILLIAFLGFPFVGILYTQTTLLQVTNHELASILLILSRQVFFLIPLIYVVPYLISFCSCNISPIMALFFCMPMADILSILFAVIVKRKIKRQAL